MRSIHAIIIACSLASRISAAPTVTSPETYQAAGSDQRIYRGTLELPAQGIWSVKDRDSSLFVVPPDTAYDQMIGRRMSEALFKKNLDAGRNGLTAIRWACQQYARDHHETGPTSTEDLDDKHYSYALKRFNQSPWEELPHGKTIEDGPFYFLIPDVPFKFTDDTSRVERTNRTELAFELHPYVNDGKHWVCYTDGSCERATVDAELMQKYGQEIQPVFEQPPYLDQLPANFTYSIFAVSSPGNRLEDQQNIVLKNSHSDKTLDLSWDLSSAAPGDESLQQELRKFNVLKWRSYTSASVSPVLKTWMALTGKETVRPRRSSGEETSILGVMGGYAAIRETFQMQQLNTDSSAGPAGDIPLSKLSGAEVESHPFEKMLDGNPGGRLALADYAPCDDLFVYMAQPQTLLSMLNGGADFISELGGTMTGNRVKYYLKERYLKRFGLTDEWLQDFLESGTVEECALLAPDLFFLNGTEITVISRLSNPDALKPLLMMIGVDVSEKSAFASVISSPNGPTYWALCDDLLIVSTGQTELNRVLTLRQNGGEGSMGQSAEFRYMLTQLPLEEQTQAYAYCSDPFIRRLVSPQTKIGQLRRMEAVKKMTVLTSGALLAKYDGYSLQSIEALEAQGYLPKGYDIDPAEYSLDAHLAAHSDTYGTLANLKPIESVPVDLVTTNEAHAYEAYVRNYTRFWRQFFDPIAIRLNKDASGEQEASIFILPLLDSSIYNGIRDSLTSREDGTSLKIPRFKPDPVLQFSINLKDEVWSNIAEGLDEVMNQLWDIESAILDDLGPGVHLSMNDGDPVIALGSGDFLGAFGANAQMMNEEEMFMIPVLLSVLTRPCTIAVETSDPEKTIMHLRHAAETVPSPKSLLGGELYSEIYQIEGRDEWVCLFDLMGVLKLRYGLEVKDGFLLIRNVPWSSQDRVVNVETSDLNAAQLKLWPAACKLQLPGLFASSAEKERAAAFQGFGFLYPLIASGCAGMENVLDEHLKLFGYTLRKAEQDDWSWTGGTLESRRYGSIFHKKQAAYNETTGDFGLLECINDLSIQMQFEQDGLRAEIRWNPRK